MFFSSEADAVEGAKTLWESDGSPEWRSDGDTYLASGPWSEGEDFGVDWYQRTVWSSQDEKGNRAPVKSRYRTK